ncbi:MAG: lipoyl synthase [Bacteroidetes bacterium]|nr:lipoyl synthase [Bacteroidota bacterium]
MEHKSVKPEWLKITPPGGERYQLIKGLVTGNNLSTVCQEARCPNMSECWGGGTATFMILGKTCTRGCRFCHVNTAKNGEPVDLQEPAKIAESAHIMGLDYVVLTMVDRDDLPDGGAGQVAATIRAIREKDPNTLIEMLAGDFMGNLDQVKVVADSNPDVYAHNIETVRRLSPTVRDGRCDYDQSLSILQWVKNNYPHQYTKSSLMVGLGETRDEMIESMKDLRKHQVDILTIGQYLRPTTWHLEVKEYIHPDQFRDYETIGKELGFLYVASGPLVRTSYRAGELFMKGMIQDRRMQTHVSVSHR